MTAPTYADLALQEPEIAWALAEGRGENDGLGWVSIALDPSAPGSVRVAGGGKGPDAFQAAPLTRWLPPAVAARVEEAVTRGAATAWEGLALLLARPSWWIASREHLYSAHGPSPCWQAALLSAWGLGPALHGHDSDRISRLVALLPVWRQRRGAWSVAQQIAHAAEITCPPLSPAGGRAAPVVLCRSSKAWGAAVPRVGALRIEAGLVRDHQLARAERPEALTLTWDGDLGRLATLLRLLPHWTTLGLQPAPAPSAPRSAS